MGDIFGYRFHHRHSSINAFITITIIITQICHTTSIDSLDSTSTEYSIIGQTSSISTSSHGASLTGPSDKITTKIYGTITPAPKIQKRTSTISDGKNKKTSVTNDGKNHSREALSHEGSQREPVVYLSDTSGYVPVTSLRGRPGVSIPPSAPYHTAPDLETWRPDPWDRDYTHRHRQNSTRVQHIEAECQDDYMKIRVGFNGSFTGLLYSAAAISRDPIQISNRPKRHSYTFMRAIPGIIQLLKKLSTADNFYCGYAYDPDCMYINGSGRDYYEFFIQLNRCGTLGKNAIHEKSRENPTNFMWNTITVQYNPLIEEEFDEHFKVTCEYGYDFWKTVTFPFLDVEVATGNPVVFTLSPPECYMEIRNGYGVGGTRVTGPVRVGDPLTLIIYMRSKYDGFDIVVNDCYAHNGANKRIQLIDEYGCPVDDKLISRFRGTWSDTGVYETQVYAYMKTFRFTGSPALYIECDVRMCHGRCPSQPCHWRNLKTVAKRDVSNQTLTLSGNSTNEEKKDSPLSDNISLFQSLRVLQEGEGDELNDIRKIKEPHESCMKTTVLATLSAGSGVLLSILTISLFITCSKLRDRKKESGIYDAYVNHKGQID